MSFFSGGCYAVLNRIVRTVRRMVPGERLEETYDEG